METPAVLKALGALAQENRLSIFRLLVQAGTRGRMVGEIAQTLSVANATLSFHLKELTHAGLIQARQEGRCIYYSADYSSMNRLLEFLTANCCVDDKGTCDVPYCAPAKTAPRARIRNGSPLRKHRASRRRQPGRSRP